MDNPTELKEKVFKWSTTFDRIRNSFEYWCEACLRAGFSNYWETAENYAELYLQALAALNRAETALADYEAVVITATGEKPRWCYECGIVEAAHADTDLCQYCLEEYLPEVA